MSAFQLIICKYLLQKLAFDHCLKFKEHADRLMFVMFFIFVPAETFDKKQVNSIFWSPNGQFCILAGLRK